MKANELVFGSLRDKATKLWKPPTSQQPRPRDHGCAAFVMLLALPYELCLLASSSAVAHEGVVVLRGLKLLRLVKGVRLLGEWKSAMLSPVSRIEIFRSFFFLTLVSHWMSCALISFAGNIEGASQSWIGYHSIDIKDRVLQYIYALNWTLSTMSTVGYGDPILPTNVERAFALPLMVVGSCVFAYGLTSSINFYKSLYEREKDYRRTQDLLLEFCRKNEIPYALTSAMRHHLLRQKKLGQGKSHLKAHGEILSHLSLSLRRDIALHVNRRILEEHTFLRGLPTILSADLVSAMKVKYLRPNEAFFWEGDQNTGEAYLVVEGQVKFLLSDRVVLTLSKNSCVGVLGLLHLTPNRRYSAVASTFCDVRVLSRDIFLKYKASSEELYHRTLECAWRLLNKCPGLKTGPIVHGLEGLVSDCGDQLHCVGPTKTLTTEDMTAERLRKSVVPRGRKEAEERTLSGVVQDVKTTFEVLRGVAKSLADDPLIDSVEEPAGHGVELAEESLLEPESLNSLTEIAMLHEHIITPCAGPDFQYLKSVIQRTTNPVLSAMQRCVFDDLSARFRRSVGSVGMMGLDTMASQSGEGTTTFDTPRAPSDEAEGLHTLPDDAVMPHLQMDHSFAPNVP